MTIFIGTDCGSGKRVGSDVVAKASPTTVQPHWHAAHSWFGLLLLLLLPLSAEARDAPCIESAHTHWEQQEYLQTIQELANCREEEFGRSAGVDYMLGTSYCRVSPEPAEGRAWLRWILYRYDLDSLSRALVEREYSLCGDQGWVVEPLPDDPNVTPEVPGGDATWAGVSTRGKVLYEPGISPVRGSVANFVAPKSPEALAGRVHPLGKPDLGLQRLDSLFGPQVSRKRALASEHFLIKAIHVSSLDLNLAVEVLESRYRALMGEFGARELKSYITVYLLPTQRRVEEIALDLHGLQVERGTLGYSFRDDFSIVASVGDEGQTLGTLVHELFHLMMRSSFGDLPAWLDEGMAALFEVSSEDGQRVYGERNGWRERVLRKEWESRPSLSALVRMNWREFDARGVERGAAVASVNQSYARYFLYYLQETDRLGAAYRALMELTPSAVGADGDPGLITERVLAETLGKPLDVVQADFEQFFLGLPPMH